MIALAFAFILFAQGGPPAGQGVVSGQVRSLEGSPAIAVRVGIIRAPTETSRPSFGSQYYYAEPPVSTTLTDDQGRYRLTNIPPGRYFIVSGTTYYPSTLDADRAAVITITPNSTMENMDFQLLRPLGGRVSGRISPKTDSRTQEKAILSGPNLQEILEVPVGADGAFEFGHVPTGAYWVDLLPPSPGMGSFRVQVGDKDVTGLELVRPATHAVTGRIVVQNGPLPRAQLAFSTLTSYVGASINPDGTFSARLHSARHRVELAGMPVGYSVTSVRVGSEDATQSVVVGTADISNVVITVGAPHQLPRLRGKIAGLANARLSSTKVQLTGPIIGRLETAVRQDGSFEFAAVTPGLYSLALSEVPELRPIPVVVTWNDAEVPIVLPAR
jgi:hypothetical protein